MEQKLKFKIMKHQRWGQMHHEASRLHIKLGNVDQAVDEQEASFWNYHQARRLMGIEDSLFPSHIKDKRHVSGN